MCGPDLSLSCAGKGNLPHTSGITSEMRENNASQGSDPSDFGWEYLDFRKDGGVVDERSELGGCWRGVAQNHLGKRTDILDGCPKAEGMMMLIRSMGPEVIAADEIGSPEDVHAMEYAMHCGCRILATVHAGSMEELRRKPLLQQLVRKGSFERYVLLGNQKRVGQVQGIYDERGSLLYREELPGEQAC